MSSIESAMTSRLISEARMPAVPMTIPSATAMVENSIGVPPAARTPCLTRSARSRWLMLQGEVSVQEWLTPMIGWRRSSAL